MRDIWGNVRYSADGILTIHSAKCRPSVERSRLHVALRKRPQAVVSRRLKAASRMHVRTFSRIRRCGLVRCECNRPAKFRHRRTKKTMTRRALRASTRPDGTDVIAFRETTIRDYCARLFSERIIPAQRGRYTTNWTGTSRSSSFSLAVLLPLFSSSFFARGITPASSGTACRTP